MVTDLPYALGSKNTDLTKLYSNFLTTLTQILKIRAVIGFPSFYNYKKLINKTNLKIEHEFTLPIHKSLSKKIVVLSP
jgi:tRNA G10  N-methylase Trm11